MAITQVITAIPQAGHRGVDTQDDFVTKQEAFQDALTGVTVSQLNAFATQANTLETNVNNKESTVIAKEALISPHYASIDTIADNITNVNTVANDLLEPVSEINTVAANIDNVNIVGTNINDVNYISANMVAINTIVSDVLPNINEILDADVNAATATAQAVIATNKANDASASAANALASEQAATALLDSFDDRYLGAKSIEPTLDNDGNALQSGALYYNTTSDMMKVYDLSLTTWIGLSFIPTDHGGLTGLSDDDHTQYHNDARGDARYYTKAEVDAITGSSGSFASSWKFN